MWDIPVNSHRYFVEPLGGIHAKTMLITRYISFIKKLRKSERPAVIYLMHKIMKNMNTVKGRNLRFVLEEIGASDIFEVNVNEIKKGYKVSELAENDSWKIDFVKEIVNVKQHVFELDDNQMTREELDDILAYLTTS